MERREFIKWTGATVVCMCTGVLGTSGCAGKPASDTPCAPVGSYRMRDGRVIVALSAVEDLQAVGGAVKFTLSDEGGSERKLIVVHVADVEYRAFADSCTHNGKELNYLRAEGKLVCCGRSSQFDLAGNVIKGPAEDTLLRYHLFQDGEELVIEI